MSGAAEAGRNSRAGRGARMGALLSEAKAEAAGEGDDEFWGQAAWQEDGADEGYVSEREEADVFDSDFEESEDEEDDEGGDEDERPRRVPCRERAALLARCVANIRTRLRRQRRKKPALRPPGTFVKRKPQARAAPPAARPLSELEGQVAAAAGGDAPLAPAPRPKPARAPVEASAELVRKSKRSTVLELEVHRERAAAEAAARHRPKPRRVVEERALTQDEMLAEAAATELVNAAGLARLLAMEEEVKKRAQVVKAVYDGPAILVRSAGDKTTLTLLRGAELPGLGGEPPVPCRKVRCVVTGQRARYMDPLTHLPYADAAAFATLRQQERERAEVH